MPNIKNHTDEIGSLNVFMMAFTYLLISNVSESNHEDEDFDIFSITFGNARQFGNNAFITPSAIIDDGII